MTFLSKYQEMYGRFHVMELMGNNAEKLRKIQEIHYRIYVLEDLERLQKILWSLDSDSDIKLHYKSLMSYIIRLTREFSEVSDDKQIQFTREQTRRSLCEVINDFRNRMLRKKEISVDEYTKAVRSALYVIVPAWIIYRDSITKIVSN